jgi:hydrogen peroxide-dependent heme synthase
MAELAPHTLHGWYALHQMFGTDRSRTGRLTAAARGALARDVGEAIATPQPTAGWTAIYELVGGCADLMFVHFRPTMAELAAVSRRLRRTRAAALLRTEYAFVSVAEAALYAATVEAGQQAPVGSEQYRQHIEQLAEAEAGAPRMRHRLQPPAPDDWPYVCFYPMNRRRSDTENWYTLPLEQRDRLLHEHGLTGRRYAGRIMQIITGSSGLSDWEWGVTLFAKDPLELKRIVTDMRFDEASARYAEFGRCFTGVRASDDWL